jgi:restriction system protein
MSEELLQYGNVQAHYSARGDRILKFSIELYHKGLMEHRLVSAPDEEILKNKVEFQCIKWEEKWNSLEEKRLKQEEKEANLEEAELRTDEAQNAITDIENILKHTLTIDDTIDWKSLKNHEEFSDLEPTKPEEIPFKKKPVKPDKDSAEFVPKISIFDRLISSMKQKKIEKYDRKFDAAISDWEEQRKEIESTNSTIEKKNEEVIKKWEGDVEDWELRKKKYYKDQKAYNEKIDLLEEKYKMKDPAAVIEYCELVLNNSKYPETFPKSFEIEYNPENQILIVEYDLPPQDCFPTIKDVKYIASRKELKDSYISESQSNKNYDNAIYQISLRTLHELFEADAANALHAIIFNGWVNSINKATGKSENKCIVSIQAPKEVFLEIELGNVDPKACFKSLKGVASTKLASLTPIQPILQITKTDKRIVEGYDVAHRLDDATNIAAMDWEDFEHLVRELFEKEFVSSGGEVRVTQASRDGGVDAIAFDPDPIRGGKIVIQAKRYTNVVGVSAVRDLYGTVVNEGATKGILVTTADYGPDAYEFAKDKPLTLLNGSNLLHLLEKHGHHARIDLNEAKKLLSED